jgi:hypothetical protein
MRCKLGGLLTACAAALGPAAARADVVHKTDGGRVEGSVLDAEGDLDFLVIQSKYGKLRIPRSEVQEVEYAEAPSVEYPVRAKQALDTADGQYALALWCLDQGLSKEYEKHLARVLEHDPDHPQARKRLGYEMLDGKWRTRDEAMAAKGYVKYRGKWMLPQEREEAERSKADQDRRQELGRVIRVALRYLRQDDPQRQALARADLLAIREPVAVPLLMNLVAKKGSADERRLLVDVLRGIEGPESTQALVDMALLDDVERNRLAAIDALKPRKSAALTSQLARELRHNVNSRVRRSAAILGEVGDSSVVPALVDAIVTTHRTVVEPSFLDRLGTMGSHKTRTTETATLPDGTTIRRNLIRGQSAQSILTPPDVKTQVIVEEIKNEEVLDALEKITGENFGFDEDAWRRWLETEYRKKAAGAKP